MTGDLVEQLIFNAYKDKQLKSSKWFKNEVYINYKYRASSDLYARLIKYQVEKYGNSLQDRGVEYVRNFQLKGTSVRNYQKQVTEDRQKLRRFEERAEHEKNKRKKTIKRKNSK